jgi:hypothetical protein
MPLFEELVRRTLAARGRAEVAQKDPAASGSWGDYCTKQTRERLC